MFFWLHKMRSLYPINQVSICYCNPSRTFSKAACWCYSKAKSRLITASDGDDVIKCVYLSRITCADTESHVVSRFTECTKASHYGHEVDPEVCTNDRRLVTPGALMDWLWVAVSDAQIPSHLRHEPHSTLTTLRKLDRFATVYLFFKVAYAI